MPKACCTAGQRNSLLIGLDKKTPLMLAFYHLRACSICPTMGPATLCILLGLKLCLGASSETSIGLNVDIIPNVNTSLTAPKLQEKVNTLKDERICSALCSLGPSALPVASLAGCAGSLLTTGMAGIVCPVSAISIFSILICINI